MIRQLAAILATAALPAGPAAAAASPVYFPSALATPSIRCAYGASGALEPIVSRFEAKWYAEQLSAAVEPSLFRPAAEGRGTTIRFTWLRSFHPPVFVRVEGLGSRSPRLIAKELSGAGGYAPGRIVKQVNRPLSGQQASVLTARLLNDLLAAPAKDCGMGCDGAQWLIEVADGTGYHFFGRWSPKDGPVREVGLALLTLTGWPIKDVY